MHAKLSKQLLLKYNTPVPRYTSYPTVPFWQDEININSWKKNFVTQVQDANRESGISIYIHLPFCESLCTYCGCNKKITKNHSVEDDYIALIAKEWQAYIALMDTRPVIKEIHLGGGTPTFFSPANLTRLINQITKYARISESHEFSIEGHPNNTTREHLETLFQLGFRRISYGVQDLDPEVQRVINRIQPFENVARATNEARKAGFQSVNFDLIYGLPLQTLSSLKTTLEKTLELAPDRVAFYSYAHVPWTSRGQRLFDEDDLPAADEKLALYQLGKSFFTANGYHDIGMDHFTLPGDDLFLAMKDGRLHRNFMGYTTKNTGMSIGLGVSAISDTGNAFAQNSKSIHAYTQLVNSGKLAVQKGFFLTEEDMVFRQYIQDISCRGKTIFNSRVLETLEKYTFPELKILEKDGLVEWTNNGVIVTETGRNFIRNICKAFDLHLLRMKGVQNNMFSRAV
jgi:oxygen-independent coproporphyrinogen III oxidase